MEEKMADNIGRVAEQKNLFQPRVFTGAYFDSETNRLKGYGAGSKESDFIHRDDVVLLELSNGVTKPMKVRTVFNPEIKSYVLDVNPWLDFMDELEELSKKGTKGLTKKEWLKIWALIDDTMDYTKGAYRVRKKFLLKYYKSDHWANTKIKYLRKIGLTEDGKHPKCVRRECVKPVKDVHHRSYDNLANEKMPTGSHRGDLEGLCRAHHLQEHPEHTVNKLGRRKTKAQTLRRNKTVSDYDKKEKNRFVF